MSRKATVEDAAVAADAAKVRSITTGEVLKERDLCPAVILRTREAGVHIGYLADYSHRDGSPLGVAELLDGRRLWWWASANNSLRRELHAIAMHGAPRAKVSDALTSYTVAGVCEVLPMSEASIKSLMVSRWDQ
jgi:hypothetical protein